MHGNESGYALLTPEEITGEETPKAPAATYLSQNFPNPFNPVTKIEFGLAAPAAVSLRIYDAAGRLVRVLEEGALAAGRYTRIWDGRDTGGSRVSSGVYFYRLDAGAFSRTQQDGASEIIEAAPRNALLYDVMVQPNSVSYPVGGQHWGEVRSRSFSARHFIMLEFRSSETRRLRMARRLRLLALSAFIVLAIGAAPASPGIRATGWSSPMATWMITTRR